MITRHIIEVILFIYYLMVYSLLLQIYAKSVPMIQRTLNIIHKYKGICRTR